MSLTRPGPRAATALVALVGVLLRLPFVAKPLSSDEAGFLIVAGQWSPGHSLYGDYWVDRPPLLIGIYQLAHVLGGAFGLRLIGIAALLVATICAAGIGRLVTDWRWAAPIVAAVPAVLMSDLLFGSLEVDGELLAVPFVLAGVYAVLRAVSRPERSLERRLLWVGAGILATLGVLVKQSMGDAFFAAAVALVWLMWRRRWRTAVEEVVLFGAGAVAAGLAIVGWAAALGTRPGPLFEAVVTFRGQASAVISQEASSATTERAHRLFEAFLGSGAWLIGLLAALSVLRWWLRRRTAEEHTEPLPFAWIAVGTAAWETVAVLAGGSYWTHYLIGMVPGSTLLVAATVRAQQVRVRWIVAVLAVITLIALPTAVIGMGKVVDDNDVEVAHYLRAHSDPGQTAVIAFGHPNLLEDTGLTEPYVNMWSLPVRVRDPHLVTFTRVLQKDRPTWVIIAGGPRIDTWAIDETAANKVIARDYRRVAVIGIWDIFRARVVTRSPGR